MRIGFIGQNSRVEVHSTAFNRSFETWIETFREIGYMLYVLKTIEGYL
jgi:hypothetical protein